MHLSSLFPRDYILDQTHPNVIARFRNRERCINSLFWSLYDKIDQGHSSVLVIDRKEDLENINYLLSKYGLKDLSIILDDSSTDNKTYLMSKRREEANLKPRLGSKIAECRKAKGLLELEYAQQKSNLSKLRIPMLGSLSISEINDKVSLHKQSNIDLEQAILRPPYTYEKYKSQKDLFADLESKHDTAFHFVRMQDPFETALFNEAEIDSVHVVLRDFKQKAYSILDRYELINNKVMDAFRSKNLAKDEEIKSKFALIMSMMYPNQPLTQTEVTKLVYHQVELYKLLNIDAVHPISASDLSQGLQLITEAVDSRLNSQFAETQASTEKFLEQLTAAHSDFPEMEALITAVNDLSAELAESKIFKENLDQRSVTFAYQKANLLKLIEKLEYGLYFIDENKAYLNWKILSSDLTTEDKTIITYLAKQNQSWDRAFEALFLEYYLNHTKPTLDSIETGDRLKYLRQDYLTNYPSVLLQKHLQYSVTTYDDENINSWGEYLDQDETNLAKRYPLIIVSSDFYHKHAGKLLANTDNFFFLNTLTKNVYQEDWLSNYFMGYDPAFMQMTEAGALDLPSPQVTNITESSYNIIKPIANLNLSEANRAAKYLGQEVHNAGAPYRIFQLKNISIVSLWSPIKNALLLSAIEEAGVKEIIADTTNNNLLPSIFAQGGSQVYLLIEDGIIKPELNGQLIIQKQLIEELKTAGINIVSLDNYKLIHEGPRHLSQTLSSITRFAKMEATVAIAP